MTEKSQLHTLSKRLQTVASMVTPGRRLLDIGCDHAYLPIRLVKEGKAPGAVVTDISAGAIERAVAHIKAAGLEDRITARLADGLEGYQDGECDTMIISGMGGPLIIDILETGEYLLDGFKEIILSPQSEIALVRRWLASHRLRLTDEKMICDQNKYYVILKAVSGEESIYAADEDEKAVQYAYGPYLIDRRDCVLADFLEKEIRRYEAALEAAERSEEPRAVSRRRELIAKKEAACRVMKSLTI